LNDFLWLALGEPADAGTPANERAEVARGNFALKFNAGAYYPIEGKIATRQQEVQPSTMISLCRGDSLPSLGVPSPHWTYQSSENAVL